MPRSRIKDKSDFSITVKYTDTYKTLAEKVIDFVKRAFPRAIEQTHFPEGEQRQAITVLMIAKKTKKP